MHMIERSNVKRPYFKNYDWIWYGLEDETMFNRSFDFALFYSTIYNDPTVSISNRFLFGTLDLQRQIYSIVYGY